MGGPWPSARPVTPSPPEPSHLGSECTSTSLLGPCAGPHIIRRVKVQRGYPPAVGYPRVGLQEVRHWQKCRGRRIAPAWVSGHPALLPWGPISLAWRVRGDELRYTETRVGVPWPLCVPNGRGGRRVGGGARHLDRGTSRLQGPRRGGPRLPTSVSQSADTFHVREEAGGSGAVWASHAGVGWGQIA